MENRLDDDTLVLIEQARKEFQSGETSKINDSTELKVWLKSLK